MEYESFIPFICGALEKYPLSQPQDIVKLLYQSEFGPAHAVSDPEAALDRLRREYASVKQEEGLLMEYIGNGYARLDLKRLDHNGVTPEQAAEWFVKSAAPAGGKAAFEKKLRRLAAESLMNELIPALAPYIAEYIKAGCPAVHHSEEYRRAYSPAYRVIRAELAEGK
ncbi:MAG: hypothetical protein IJM18_02125 [Clostridia bacterium]|nr:hypothetical protein [Clostridia bacterium]